jgi:hypothetical protein
VELSSPLLLSHNHHQHGPGSFSPFASGIPTTLPQVFTDGSGASTPQCPVTRIVRSGAITTDQRCSIGPGKTLSVRSDRTAFSRRGLSAVRFGLQADDDVSSSLLGPSMLC